MFPTWHTSIYCQLSDMYIDWYFTKVNELDVQLGVHLKLPLIRLDRN